MSPDQLCHFCKQAMFQSEVIDVGGVSLKAHPACVRAAHQAKTLEIGIQLATPLGPPAPSIPRGRKPGDPVTDADWLRAQEMAKAVAHLCTHAVGDADSVVVLTEALGIICLRNSDPLEALTVVVETLADIRGDIEVAMGKRGPG